MSVNSDPDGGYLVDPEYGGIIKTFKSTRPRPCASSPA